MTYEIFNNEIFYTVNFNRMCEIMCNYKNEHSRHVTDNKEFTKLICSTIIGVLNPGVDRVNGIFYATGEALNELIRKVKKALDLWNYDCDIQIDNNKMYVINNTIPGCISLSEAH